jgi:uncharacterized protein with ACT and thioredoxin-like domain
VIDGRRGELVAKDTVPVEGERIAADPLQGVHALDRLETLALVI